MCNWDQKWNFTVFEVLNLKEHVFTTKQEKFLVAQFLHDFVIFPDIIGEIKDKAFKDQYLLPKSTVW